MPSHVRETYEDRKNDLVVKDFGGVNTQAGRTAIGENEFAWLENVIPIGYANMKAVPHQGVSVATFTTSTIAYWKYVNLHNTDYLAIIGTNGAATVLNLATGVFSPFASAGVFTLPVAIAQWENDRILIVDANNYRSWDGVTAMLSNGMVSSIDVTAAGAAYTAIPTVTLTGGGGNNAAASAAMMVDGAVAINAAGGLYAVGDLLTMAGGTFTVAAQLRVETVGGGGTVTSVSIYTPGSYTVLPAVPNAVTGGSGAGCTVTPIYAVESIIVTNPGGPLVYNTPPVVGFAGGGGGAGAAATAVLMLGPDGGQTIATAFGRVWVGKNRTVTYSAPASFVDFTTANAGGSFVVTDEALHSNISALVAANNFLYLFGVASINVISDVRVTGTPAVTVFSNTNVSSIIGSDMASSIFPFGRTVAFATRFGFYALVGATPQKISDPLDGVIPLIDFNNTVSGDVGNVFNIVCIAFLFRYNDPDGTPRPLIALLINKKWFFASQGAISRVVCGFKSGVPWLYGTDGHNIYRLFSDDSTDVDVTVVTPLWPLKAPTQVKQTLKGGIELITTDVSTQVMVDVDSDWGTQSGALFGNNDGQWINGVGVTGPWINGASVTGNWLATGFQIYQGNIEAYGRYLGYTVTTQARGFSIGGMLLQYERKAEWGVRG